MTDSLSVRRDEHKTITSQTYQFDNLVIEPGGHLTIIGSKNWAVLWVINDARINGRITARGWNFQNRTVSALTPNNKRLSYTYPLNAVGGNGGNGGIARVNGQFLQGGRGARGTTAFGGGGGSGAGAYIMGAASHLTEAGYDAFDWQAARPSASGPVSEGNGGRRPNASQGGLLLVHAFGTADVRGALFDLNGEDGPEGKPGGGTVYDYRGFHVDVSGGGGGAPGGDGGRLLLVANTIVGTSNFEIQVAGGRGGAPGGIAGPYPEGSSPGSIGDNGDLGVFDMYRCDDWTGDIVAGY